MRKWSVQGCQEPTPMLLTLKKGGSTKNRKKIKTFFPFFYCFRNIRSSFLKSDPSYLLKLGTVAWPAFLVGRDYHAVLETHDFDLDAAHNFDFSPFAKEFFMSLKWNNLQHKKFVISTWGLVFKIGRIFHCERKYLICEKSWWKKLAEFLFVK